MSNVTPLFRPETEEDRLRIQVQVLTRYLDRHHPDWRADLSRQLGIEEEAIARG